MAAEAGSEPLVTALAKVEAAVAAGGADLRRLLIARDLEGANGLLRRMGWPLARLRVETVRNARAAPAAPIWRVEPDGRSCFRFHDVVYDREPEQVFGRFVLMLPLIGAALEHLAPGRCSFNLGDEGHRPGLAFCDHRPEFTLIPDCVFLMTRGYAELQRGFAAQAIPWEARRPVLFWRGTTTGRHDSIEALDRTRLCHAAKWLGDRADISYSSVTTQFAYAERELHEAGLLRDYVPIDRLDRYQFHIDIDGNSNSWPGLMAKLHSGSPVLKIASPYRQWYYDRLVPWRHFVPVRADLDDLADMAALLFQRPDLARTIGEEGRRLAREMTLEGEIRRALPAIRRAFEPLGPAITTSAPRR